MSSASGLLLELAVCPCTQIYELGPKNTTSPSTYTIPSFQDTEFPVCEIAVMLPALALSTVIIISFAGVRPPTLVPKILIVLPATYDDPSLLTATV